MNLELPVLEEQISRGCMEEREQRVSEVKETFALKKINFPKDSVLSTPKFCLAPVPTMVSKAS